MSDNLRPETQESLIMSDGQPLDRGHILLAIVQGNVSDSQVQDMLRRAFEVTVDFTPAELEEIENGTADEPEAMDDEETADEPKNTDKKPSHHPVISATFPDIGISTTFQETESSAVFVCTAETITPAAPSGSLSTLISAAATAGNQGSTSSAAAELSAAAIQHQISSEYTLFAVATAYPSNKAYYHTTEVPGDIHVPPFQKELWTQHYAIHKSLTGDNDPVVLKMSGQNPTAMTPASNPGGPTAHETREADSHHVPTRTMEGTILLTMPKPPRTETVCAEPDYSNCDENDEETFYSLLEFRADPEASLSRRIKDKLGHLSKKDRNAIFQTYLARQKEEMEIDHLRDLTGTNAASAATMWEQDEQTEDPAEAAEPDTDYGYVPAHPVLSEKECWDEYWEYFYSMTISERNKFVEAIVWYGYMLAAHVKWYTIKQEQTLKAKEGEAELDPSAPIFPPNPAGNKALGDAKPHVLLAFGALPFGNHFMSAMHLATVVVSTAKEMVKIMAREAKEQAGLAAAAPVMPPNAAQILRDLDEAYGLMDDLSATLVAAEKMAAVHLSRAIKAEVFYPDTDELTADEEEEEERAPKPKKKKGKKGKKGKKKDKGKAKATEPDDVDPAPADKGKGVAAADDASPPSPPPPSTAPLDFDYASLLPAPPTSPLPPPFPFAPTAEADGYTNLPVPGYDFCRVPDAAVGSASLAAADAERFEMGGPLAGDQTARWAEYWEDEPTGADGVAGAYRHEGEAAGVVRVPHRRDEVTGREGGMYWGS